MDMIEAHAGKTWYIQHETVLLLDLHFANELITYIITNLLLILLLRPRQIVVVVTIKSAQVSATLTMKWPQEIAAKSAKTPPALSYCTLFFWTVTGL